MRCIRTCIFGMILMWVLLLTGCQGQSPSAPVESKPVSPPKLQEPQGTSATETENLVKLCKVWGYTKYMHPAFLLGKKDWDEELLTLIPQVREMTTAEEVNELLHTWFVSLGEIDYKSWSSNPIWKAAKEEDKVVIADLSWTEDAAYLGEALAADFAQFPEQLPNVDRRKAPISFDSNYRYPIFDNEPEHAAAYDDPNFRLLGMFRLWNAFEYFYPYLHLIDRDWEELLTEQIPEMLVGTDEASYARSLWLLARETRDTHTAIVGGPLETPYHVPVSCIPAEGGPAIWCTADGVPLERGDVLLSIDSQTVDKILEEEFGDYSRKELMIEYMWSHGIDCAKERTELGILRNGKEMMVTCKALNPADSAAQVGSEVSYDFLDSNIGYININMVKDEDILEAIEAFRDTQGLVIDLREYPQFWPQTIKQLYAYVLGRGVKPLILARPAVAIPGAYVKDYAELYGSVSGFNEGYDKTVVVLINEGTGSAGDTAATIFRAAENTVLMGSNTKGCNGNTVEMPLPGGLGVRFSYMGAYHADGTQTQRTGIAPDIRVEPTIQGIAEGRDEVLEAAVEHIKNKS